MILNMLESKATLKHPLIMSLLSGIGKDDLHDLSFPSFRICLYNGRRGAPEHYARTLGYYKH